MILIEVKPRQDNLFDIYVGDEGDHFVNSNQGYENVEDAIAIVHKLWPPLPTVDALGMEPDDRGLIEDVLRSVAASLTNLGPIVLRVTYRNGKTKTEQLR